jgi:hypothetical protein
MTRSGHKFNDREEASSELCSSCGQRLRVDEGASPEEIVEQWTFVLAAPLRGGFPALPPERLDPVSPPVKIAAGTQRRAALPQRKMRLMSPTCRSRCSDISAKRKYVTVFTGSSTWPLTQTPLATRIAT